MIPKNIFKTHKSKEFIFNNECLKNADDSWSKWQNKGFNYYFYDNDMCNKFMKEHFSTIKDAYDKLPLGVMKADLWRYCIIYKYGGIYHDADTELKVNPIFLTNYNNKYLIVVPENDVHFCQWVFAAPANSPVLKSIIDLSVERIRNCVKIKGEHIIHYLTGPGVFTDGIFKYLNMNTHFYEEKNDKQPIKYSREEGILKFQQGFIKKNIGSSTINNKSLKINNIFDPNKELSFKHKFIDTFSYKFDNDKLTISRTDSNSGWGQDLNVYQSNKLINIGSSISNSKTISNMLDPNKELSFIYDYDDNFSYKFVNDQLTITRTDINTGWGQDLFAYQFNSISNILIMPHELFHNNCVKHLFSGQWDGGWCEQRTKYLL